MDTTTFASNPPYLEGVRQSETGKERNNNSTHCKKNGGGVIVRRDKSNKGKTTKEKAWDDYNPIIKIPIKGV